MAAKCTACNSNNIRRTASNLVFDDYVCRACGTAFERISPTAKRWAIIGGFTLLTAGLDFGGVGMAAASMFDMGEVLDATDSASDGDTS